MIHPLLPQLVGGENERIHFVGLVTPSREHRFGGEKGKGNENSPENPTIPRQLTTIIRAPSRGQIESPTVYILRINASRDRVALRERPRVTWSEGTVQWG